jgi:hypothetical protein
MTTARQVETNRANARHSTGPRTARGRARVAQNAVTHGLLAHETLLPDEDPQALQTLAETLRAEHNPQGAQEHLLVDMMIRAAWRLSRLGRVEAGVFARKQFGILTERANRAARSYERGAVNVFGVQDAQLPSTDAEKHHAAVAQATQMTTLRESPAATLGLTFIRGSSGADPLSKLHRYEASIERGYFRALHELQRLQHARLGGHVPPPLAIEISVNNGAAGGADRQAGAPETSRAGRQAARSHAPDQAAPNTISAKQTQKEVDEAEKSIKLDSY